MIVLDDQEFKKGTIIDIVYQPGMPIGKIIDKMTYGEPKIIVLDTDGQLHQHFNSTSASLLPSYNAYGGNYNTVESQQEQKVLKEYSCLAKQANDVMPKPVLTYKQESMSDVRIESFGVMSQDTQIHQSIDEDSLFGENLFSSQDCMTNNEYLYVSSGTKLLYYLETVKTKRNFVLIINTITLLFDFFPKNIQDTANLLWDLVYSCDATIITLNHYRINKNRNKYNMIARGGITWQRNMSYQVLMFYNFQNEIKFTIDGSAEQ
ncbi:hypothetical protein ENBRE01_0671 [Enteropsectra breve]|nr:hypothetical protein ENBRE01_0671 [Enteropsectra breve]